MNKTVDLIYIKKCFYYFRKLGNYLNFNFAIFPDFLSRNCLKGNSFPKEFFSTIAIFLNNETNNQKIFFLIN